MRKHGPKREPMVNWKDVPEPYRVTREYLLSRVGGVSPVWVERHLHGGGCRAARRFSNGLFAPCGGPPFKRSRYCWNHRWHRGLWAIRRWIKDYRRPYLASLPLPWQ